MSSFTGGFALLPLLCTYSRDLAGKPPVLTLTAIQPGARRHFQIFHIIWWGRHGKKFKKSCGAIKSHY